MINVLWQNLGNKFEDINKIRIADLELFSVIKCEIDELHQLIIKNYKYILKEDNNQLVILYNYKNKEDLTEEELNTGKVRYTNPMKVEHELTNIITLKETLINISNKFGFTNFIISASK